MNIDKDIEILKEFENYSPYEEIGETGKQAISNVLSELETYKKIAEKLAELMEQDKEIPIECMNNAIDWARKEVEKDD